MKITHLIAAACIALGGPAALAGNSIIGSGKAVTQQRAASDFTGIGLAVPALVEVVQGGAEGLTLTADDNVAAEIETVVERGVLKIRFREKNLNVRPATRIRITINARTVESLAISGSGDISAPALSAQKLAVSIAGSGDVSLGGKADSLAVNISGSGDVKAGKFETDTTSVRIAGSGDATVWARKSLAVSVAGSGDVRYYGDPSISKQVAGSGSVRRAEPSPS